MKKIRWRFHLSGTMRAKNWYGALVSAVFIFPKRGNLPPTGFIEKCLSSFRLYVVSIIRKQKCNVWGKSPSNHSSCPIRHHWDTSGCISMIYIMVLRWPCLDCFITTIHFLMLRFFFSQFMFRRFHCTNMHLKMVLLFNLVSSVI